MFHLPLRCRCGQVRGTADVFPTEGFRFVCYCTDCQAFAQWLERLDVLDAAGGTDIFQMPPARMRITVGTERLRTIRRSEKVLRWFADCCRTPIANTAARAGFPIVALIHSFRDHEADGRSADEVLGPPRCGIFERSATAPPASRLPPASVGVLVVRASKLLGWWVRGLAWPTPFFDARTKAPVTERS
jgi:hypothetical protein